MIMKYPRHACVIEFKGNEPPRVALNQINRKAYYRHLRTEPFQHIDCLGLSFTRTAEDTPRLAMNIETWSSPWYDENDTQETTVEV